MTKKCIGCGVKLQDKDSTKVGYITDIENDLCERCFRIRNYGEYKKVDKDNVSYLKILEDINNSDDLVLFVIDLFNLNKEVYELARRIKVPCLIVLTKRDLFAKDIYNQKFIDRIYDIPVHIQDYALISSKNNEGFDDLFTKIKKYQTSKNVYVVGLTNAGKSTMINKIISLYFNSNSNITTSMLPSTTLDTIEIPLGDDLTFIDTPGIIDNSIENVIDAKTLKRITPKKTIRPITYQIKVNQSIVIEELLQIDIPKDNNITLFFANNLNIMRYYKKHTVNNNLVKHEFVIEKTSDILISGLGFIKVMKPCKLVLYTLDNVEVSLRKALI